MRCQPLRSYRRHRRGIATPGPGAARTGVTCGFTAQTSQRHEPSEPFAGSGSTTEVHLGCASKCRPRHGRALAAWRFQWLFTNARPASRHGTRPPQASGKASKGRAREPGRDGGHSPGARALLRRLRSHLGGGAATPRSKFRRHPLLPLRWRAPSSLLLPLRLRSTIIWQAPTRSRARQQENGGQTTCRRSSSPCRHLALGPPQLVQLRCLPRRTTW